MEFLLLMLFGRDLHLICFDLYFFAAMSHICGSRSGGTTKVAQCSLAP